MRTIATWWWNFSVCITIWVCTLRTDEMGASSECGFHECELTTTQRRRRRSSVITHLCVLCVCHRCGRRNRSAQTMPTHGHWIQSHSLNAITNSSSTSYMRCSVCHSQLLFAMRLRGDCRSGTMLADSCLLLAFAAAVIQHTVLMRKLYA